MLHRATGPGVPPPTVPDATDAMGAMGATGDPAATGGAVRGLRRVLGISVSLVSTHALTSILGLVFWGMAARALDPAAIGIAGALVALMMLLGSVGSLGLGTLLISRLPAAGQGGRRRLVRSCLLAAGTSGGVLGTVIGAGVVLAGDRHLGPAVAGPLPLAALVCGTALTAVTMVLDQAVLVLGVGSLQLERNILASVTKAAVLPLLVAVAPGKGMAVVGAWTVGNAVSLPWVAFRTRGGRPLEDDGPLIDLRLLKGLRRDAAGHHALNLALQAPMQLLPVVVTLALSPRDNGYFNSAVLVTGFVFALPYALSVGLFAAAGGDEQEVLRRIRWTIPFGLGVSLAATLALYPLAPTVLHVFGSAYALQAAGVLRLIVLAGAPFVVKDHFIALRRVQGRTAQAALLSAGFCAAELAAAAVGARVHGLTGLVVAWIATLMLEALGLAVPLFRGARRAAVASATAPGAAALASSAAETTRPRTLLAEPPLPDREVRVTAVSSRVSPSPYLVAPSPYDVDASPLFIPEAPGPAAADDHLRPPAAPATCPMVLYSPAPVTDSMRLPTLGPEPEPAETTHRGRHVIGADEATTATDLTGPMLLTMSTGLLMLAVASATSRVYGTGTGVELLYAASLVAMFAPAVVRILHPRTRDHERVVLALALPVLLQLSRPVLRPNHFAYHDELIHQNTLRLINATHQLFVENPLLPVSGYYPGLESATAAVQSMTGVTPYVAATAVLLLARVVLATALLGIVGALTGSTRIACIASVVYVCNPQLIFFNSQFSYQTIALPLSLFAVYLVLTRGVERRSAFAPIVAVLVAVALCHHLTAMLLVVALVVVAVLHLVPGRRQVHEALTIGALALAGAVAVVAVALQGRNPVLGYLLAIVRSSTTDLQLLLAGQPTKGVFTDSAGLGSTVWEQVLMVSAVLAVAVALGPALWRCRPWWRFRIAFAMALMLLAALYPLIPSGHVARATSEVGDRSAGFVFIGIAFVFAWAIHDQVLDRAKVAALSTVTCCVFLGNVVLGAGPISQQLPGRYEVAADAHSIDSDNIAASYWMGENLPRESRVYADRVTGLLTAAVGQQFTVRHVSTGVDASRLLLDPHHTAQDAAVARAARIAYLVVDLRDADGLPHAGVYIEFGEFGEQPRTTPVPITALTKFAGVPGIQRIYDNGSIIIYDIRGLWRAH